MPNLASPGLSLAAAVSWGAADFSGGLAAKTANVFGVVALAHAVGLAFMLSLAVVFGETIPPRSALLWGAVAGLVGGIGLAAFYKALAIGKMGLNAPLASVITAVLPLLFSLWTEGAPHVLQLAGFALALVSIWLISMQRGAGGGSSRGLGLAVLAGIGFSGFLLFIKLAGSASVFWPLVAARSASLLLMTTIILTSRGHWKPGRVALPYILIAGILDSGANALYVAAAQRGRLDVAAVLSSLYPASTVILARLVLKERLSGTQSAGMAAALVAVLLIAAR
ncbi:MAG: DMT family transporter [Terriglobales bacterium]